MYVEETKDDKKFEQNLKKTIETKFEIVANRQKLKAKKKREFYKVEKFNKLIVQVNNGPILNFFLSVPINVK